MTSSGTSATTGGGSSGATEGTAWRVASSQATTAASPATTRITTMSMTAMVAKGSHTVRGPPPDAQPERMGAMRAACRTTRAQPHVSRPTTSRWERPRESPVTIREGACGASGAQEQPVRRVVGLVRVGVAERRQEGAERLLVARRDLDADEDPPVVGALGALVKKGDVPVRPHRREEAHQRPRPPGKLKAVHPLVGRAGGAPADHV